jgi:hypothetical protein
MLWWSWSQVSIDIVIVIVIVFGLWALGSFTGFHWWSAEVAKKRKNIAILYNNVNHNCE